MKNLSVSAEYNIDKSKRPDKFRALFEKSVPAGMRKIIFRF